MACVLTCRCSSATQQTNQIRTRFRHAKRRLLCRSIKQPMSSAKKSCRQCLLSRTEHKIQRDSFVRHSAVMQLSRRCWRKANGWCRSQSSIMASRMKLLSNLVLFHLRALCCGADKLNALTFMKTLAISSSVLSRKANAKTQDTFPSEGHIYIASLDSHGSACTET